MSGQRLDSHTHYETLEQLEDYCYRVAGSVGEMLLPVLHTDPDARIVEAVFGWQGDADRQYRARRGGGSAAGTSVHPARSLWGDGGTLRRSLPRV